MQLYKVCESVITCTLSSLLINIYHLGRLRPVWEFFTERIRLKNEVDLIRGNLKLQDEKRKRKCSNNEEDDDDYEINVVTRSLHKTKKQMLQLDHEINRLQTLCYEMNVSKDDLKQRLNRSASQRGQVIEHKEKLEEIVHFYRQKMSEISQWVTDLNQNQDKNITGLAKELQPVLMKVMNHEEKFQFNENKFTGVHPKQVIQDLLELTRALGIKVNAEIDKIPKSLPQNQGDIDNVLEDMHVLHLEYYQNCLNATKQIEMFENEILRLVEENVKDENIKSFIKLRQVKRSGQTTLEVLKKNVRKSTPMACDDLPNMFNHVEKQSKKILGVKLLIEEFLVQTLNHKERVIQHVQEVDQQRSKIQFGMELHDLETKNLGLYDPAVNTAISIDRCRDARLSKLPLLMQFFFKPSFNHLLKKTMAIMLYKDLKMTYSEDMKNFEQFGNVKAVLYSLQKSVTKENHDLSELIQRKLKFGDNSTSGKSRPCEKLLHAIRIWSLEPASTAYAKSIKGKYKDRTLDDWYNYMRSNE